MSRLSYAQNYEDIVLSRLFPPGYKGFYIDAGANHPVTNNVTKLFYDMGWSGINIEPLAHIHKLLVEQRPRDINLHAGVSDRNCEMKFFRVRDPNPDETSELSHFDPARADDHRKLGWPVIEDTVPVMTLKDICEKYVTVPIDFLKLDVEGFERLAIIGADFQKFRPRCIVIEDGQWGHTRARFHWSNLLEEQGYKLILHDGVNVFFIDKNDTEAAEKLQYPASTVDNFTPMWYFRAVQDAQAREAHTKQQLASVQKELSLLKLEEARLKKIAAEYQTILEEVGPNALETIRGWARWVRKSPGLAKLGKGMLGK